jgi:hypothetical protein
MQAIFSTLQIITVGVREQQVDWFHHVDHGSDHRCRTDYVNDHGAVGHHLTR